MQNVRRIWTNAAWLSVIPLGLNVVSLFSTGLIARTLGTAAFGRFSMGAAIVALTIPIADLGLRSRTARELSLAGAGANRTLCDLLSLRTLLSVLATVVALVVATFVSNTSGLRNVVLITTLTIIPVTIAGTLSDGLMARNRGKAISGAGLWSGILLTIASVIGALRWRSAEAVAAAYVIGPCVNMVLLARVSRSEYGAVTWRWRPRYWKALLRRAAPFFQVSVLTLFVARLDTVVVGALFGESIVGAFAAATSLSDRLWILIDSVASAVLPTLTRLRAEPKRLQAVLSEMMYPLLAILTAGSLLAVSGATAVVTLFFGQAYAAGGPALAVSLLFLPVLALDTLVGEGFLAVREDAFVVRTGVRGQLATLILVPFLPVFLGVVGVRVARIGILASVIPRVQASRSRFPELWDREKIRRLGFTVLWVVPLAAAVLIIPLPPIVAVLVTGGGFVCWTALIGVREGYVRRLLNRPASAKPGSAVSP